MKLTFDTTALTQAGPTAPDVYVTFTANSSDMVYGSGQETINFSEGNITIGDAVYGTSKAYKLTDVIKNGLVLNSATSLVGFISYGSADGIQKLPKGTQPNFLNSATPRFSIFEVSYHGTGGGADITNISQYGGSIKMAFMKKGEVQCEVENTLDTTSTFKALAAASGFSGTASAAVYLDSQKQFVRVVGTNVFPNGPHQNPYPPFNAYLESLFTSAGSKSVVKELTNLAPPKDPLGRNGGAGGPGSVGLPSSSAATKVAPNKIYNLDYHFTAVLTQATAPSSSGNDPNGTYGVKLSGYVNATLADPQSGGIAYHKYDGLSITVPADDLASGNLYMTNFIYQAAVAGTGIKVTSSGWNDLITDFGAANVDGALLKKVAGDFAQGITCGFLGSTTTDASGKKLGDMTSYEWWQNSVLAYAPAQPENPFYSAYGNVVSAHSAGFNKGKRFSRGGVYGSPYDDRFDLNLIAPDKDTDEMRITLLADGSLKPG